MHNPLSIATRFGGLLMLAPLINSCATPQSYADWNASGAAATNVGEILLAPDNYLAQNEGKRMLIAGYFQATELVERAPFVAPDGVTYDSCLGSKAQPSLSMGLNLPLTRKHDRRALNHWIIVEAEITAPRDLAIGEYIAILLPKEDQHMLLDNARIVAIDQSRTCKIPQK